ncbi:efflux RND transporter periplasmic adaptor subunit [Euzebyella marina]|uniref:Efflux RND transporter periplasmic adaptor subunit n=1 Tax=Euzebyella marina TaxID=1761453 RepID=A0A3G2L888_9FLAO|nr:efflux RND transporter periplasmic adaptor subunit [Euzebyella marina]AYN68413.1 efflux RND transporter periplasmic adaptor subunit [Euzebyella marina]
MKHKKTVLGLIAVAIVATVIFGFFKSDTSSRVSVNTVKVTKNDIAKLVTATGTVEPINQVEVGTQVSGVVEKIYVDFNSEVKEGQLIAELDKTNLKATLSQSKATYENAVAERDYLKTIYERQKTLFDNKVISQADYDEAFYNYSTAKSVVTQRLSDLQKAQSNLGYANIYSPISGVVLSRDIDEGQTVAASYSTPTLFTIAQDLEQMQVEADVDEADIGEVNEGQRVTFTVDAYPDKLFDGQVTQVRLNPTETSNVITYTVVIKAENPDLKLKPGLTATVSIYTLELQGVLSTEAKAVNFKPDMAMLKAYAEQNEFSSPEGEQSRSANNADGTVVWALDNSGRIVPRKVDLGESDGVNVQVLNGLDEGESLVYSLKSESEVPSVEGESSSPFMPKPPGSNKKSK